MPPNMNKDSLHTGEFMFSFSMLLPVALATD